MERQYSFPAILSALLMTLALGGAVIGCIVQDWYVMAAAGIVVFAGIGWAVIAVREVLGDE